MRDLFLKKSGDTVKVFYSEEEMIAAGFTEADEIITEEEFNSNGCNARVINDEIVIGKTPQEIAKEQIAEIDNDLAALDRKFLTPRILAGLTEGDEYALGERRKHNAAAEPLRAKRKSLEAKAN